LRVKALTDRQLRAALRTIQPGPDPRWQGIHAAITAAIRAGDLGRLQTLLTALERPAVQVYRRMVWLGRMHAGVEGARRVLAEAHRAPPGFGGPEDWGAILGMRCDESALAQLVDLAAPLDGPLDAAPSATAMLRAAIQERVLRDGAVTHPALVGWWTEPGLPLTAHPWERGLVPPPHDRFDVFGNLYGAPDPWPAGGPALGPAPERVTVTRVWGLDDDWDPVGPPEAAPTGPFQDRRLYPNGSTWCFAGHASSGDLSHLAAWPWPPEHLSLGGRQAVPASPRALLRQWIARGLVAGAYGTGRCVARARPLAWSSLGQLTDCSAAPGDLDAIAAATGGWQVWSFESAGPSVEHLGGDFGWVARGPHGRAWAAAHSDTD
jgi:hypothetical protein